MVSCGAAEHLLTWLSRCGWSDHVATMAFGIIAQTARQSTPQLRPRVASSAALRPLLDVTRILLADPAHASTEDLGKAAVHRTCADAIAQVMSLLATAAATAAAPAAIASAATTSMVAAVAAAEMRVDYAADLAPFVPLLSAAAQRYAAAAADGDQVGVAVHLTHAALASLFITALTSAMMHTAPLHTVPLHVPTADDANYVTSHQRAAADGVAADDDSLRNDFAAFLHSPAFDGVLQLLPSRSVENGPLTAVRLLRCAADLDGELCAAVFTAPRVTAIADFVDHNWYMLSAPMQTLLAATVARLAAGPAALAARLVSAGLLQSVLAHGLSGAPARGARTEPQPWALATELALLLDNALQRPQSACVRTALREGGVVLFCVRVVLAAALFDAGTNTDAVARALAVLRMLVAPHDDNGFDDAEASISGDAEAGAEAEVNAPLHGDFLVDFVKAHGKHAIALLRCADELPDSVVLALGELEAALAAAGVAPASILLSLASTPAGSDAASVRAAAAVAVSPEEAVAGVRAFAAAHGGDWLAAFDAHIAAVLRRGGYPASGGAETVTALAPTESRAPSAVALALLQARARECVRLQALATVGPTCMGTDMHVVMVACFTPPQSEDSGAMYHLMVTLHDDAFPTHAAHFRAATRMYALGAYVHRCFAPAGVDAAALPYVSLYRHKAPCAAAPLALPAEDLIYGEAAALVGDRDADVVYPSGTLLMCARSVLPPLGDVFNAPQNILCFVTFKPCAARLLPAGAVPVGRVVACVDQNAHIPRRAAASATVPDAVAAPAAEQPSPHHPFDETVMTWFEALCQGGAAACDTNSRIRYYNFLARRL